MKRLLLIIVITLPLMQSCDFFQKKNMFTDNDDTAELYRDKQDSLEFVDSIKKLQNELAQLRMKHQQLRDSVSRKTTMKAQPKSGYKYHIIVGSFKTPDYLNSYNRYVKERGFDTRILRNKYGFNLIAVESTNNWQQALSTLEELQEGFEESAWLYVER